MRNGVKMGRAPVNWFVCLEIGCACPLDSVRLPPGRALGSLRNWNGLSIVGAYCVTSQAPASPDAVLATRFRFLARKANLAQFDKGDKNR